jgi:hypothetical protein
MPNRHPGWTIIFQGRGFVKPRPRRGGSCPAPLRLGGFGGTAVSGKPVRDRPNDPLSEKGQEVFLKYELGEAGCLALEGPASSKEEHDLFLEGRIEYDWQAGVPPSAHPEPRPVSALRVGVLGDAALAAAPRSALAAVRAVADRPLAADQALAVVRASLQGLGHGAPHFRSGRSGPPASCSASSRPSGA